MDGFGKEFAEILACLPCGPDYAWDWEKLQRSSLSPLFVQMAATQQHIAWHGEGDVWTHTRMVCQTLAQLPDFRALAPRRQQALALAALLHDLGKIRCYVHLHAMKCR